MELVFTLAEGKRPGPGVRLLEVGVPDPYSTMVFTDTLVLASVVQKPAVYPLIQPGLGKISSWLSSSSLSSLFVTIKQKRVYNRSVN